MTSGSPCSTCKHFNAGVIMADVCPAYPKQIPNRIFVGGLHDEVQPDQEGTTAWEPAPGFEYLDRRKSPEEHGKLLQEARGRRVEKKVSGAVTGRQRGRGRALRRGGTGGRAAGVDRHHAARDRRGRASRG